MHSPLPTRPLVFTTHASEEYFLFKYKAYFTNCRTNTRHVSYLFECIFQCDSKYSHQIPVCYYNKIMHSNIYLDQLSPWLTFVWKLRKFAFQLSILNWTCWKTIHLTRYVCTYLNAFLMVIPNMAMKFNNFDIFYQICKLFHLSPALACRVLRIWERGGRESHNSPRWFTIWPFNDTSTFTKWIIRLRSVQIS